MEILEDIAIILKKNDVNESNLSITLFTRQSGKINAICYGVRSANKKEKISLNPVSVCDIRLKKTNDNYIIEKNNLNKVYISIFNNIYKMQICMYIVYSLNKILLYNISESNIFDKVIEIFEYIDKNSIDKNNFYFILYSYLRSISIELGIYRYKNNIVDFKKEFIGLEKIISQYFEIELDYNNIINIE